jgi:hypothetical protein
MYRRAQTRKRVQISLKQNRDARTLQFCFADCLCLEIVARNKLIAICVFLNVLFEFCVVRSS